MNYNIDSINRIINGDLVAEGARGTIGHLLTDSRRLIFPSKTLFFAIVTSRRDGHEFITALYEQGVRNFVVSRHPGRNAPFDANFIVVRDTVEALQRLAAWHRHRFEIPVIGITGSNGKTIVKEWLHQLLSPGINIVRSPASYNSQVGVPLSVWLMNEKHQLGIFEAGISTVGEMQKLQPIIDPTVGIFTNIGDAHNEGFESREQKLNEKLLLFRNCDVVIYHADEPLLNSVISSNLSSVAAHITWGSGDHAKLQIVKIDRRIAETTITAQWAARQISVTIPFTDEASIGNAIHCWCVMLHFAIDDALITEKMKSLTSVAMRMEMKSGINNCSVINDSYSADLSSLRIALDFLSQQKQHATRTVILSDILQSGLEGEELYKEVTALLQQHQVDRLIGIGTEIEQHAVVFSTYQRMKSVFFPSVAAFRAAFNQLVFRNETILIKGARVFELEGIDHLLQQQVHQTVLEIDLNAVVHNLNAYKHRLSPGTKIMAMVKAFSYGSGSFEIANVLQFQKVDYLAVAYADEGIALRQGGITLPVMVMNTDAAAFDALLQYSLEPDLYNPIIYREFFDYCEARGVRNVPVHLEVETGMNRLGFAAHELNEIRKTPVFRVISVFSHLVASDEAAFDEFTNEQAERFRQMTGFIETSLGHSVIKHIANTSGASRHPHLQFDMVRLGIGLYGVDAGISGGGELREVSTLKTTVSHISFAGKNETVGYGRRGRLAHDSVIATVRIGYADGYSRRFGNGRGKMLVNGKPAPVIGSVCMDMTMLDVTAIDNVSVGDEVVVFGADLSVKELASWAETIPYEILTGVSQRVKRVYFEE